MHSPVPHIGKSWLLALLVIAASLTGCGGTSPSDVAVTLSRIDITPTTPSIAKGTTQQFTATGVFSDATTQDLTAAATWASSDATKAPINNTTGSKGLATGATVGSATISATLSGIAGSTVLTVTPAVLRSVQVTPTTPSIAKGTTQQFTATGVFSDATTQDLTAAATWASSDATKAPINNTTGSKGLATGATVGSATISATLSGIAGSTVLTVTPVVLTRVDVTPTNPSVPKSRTQPFTAMGVYSDATTQDLTSTATWASSDTAIAQVGNAASNKGLVATLAEGITSISATSGGKSGTSTLTVTPATLTSLSITPASTNLPKSFNRQFAATGLFEDGTTRDVTQEVTWTSSDTGKASISNASGSKGLANGVAAGNPTIIAQQGSIRGTASLTVTGATLSSIGITPANSSMPLGTNRQLAATGTFSDSTTENITDQVTWGSGDASLVTISNAAGSKGLAQSVKAGGPVTVTATRAGATPVSGTTNLTVSPAALRTIEVSPATITKAKGQTQQYAATGTYTDNTTSTITTQVTWSSSDKTAVTLSNAPGSKGLATAVAEGSATIKASSGGVEGTASMAVTAAVLQSIAVTSTHGSVVKGSREPFAATGTYSDGSKDITNDVTWTSTDETLATISNATADKGIATASATNTGTTAIIATLGSQSGQRSLKVTAAVLTSITIAPVSSVPKGLNRQLQATGNYSDGTTKDVTSTVTWGSDKPDVASVSNDSVSKGLLTASAVGTAKITATDPDSTVTNSTAVTVSNAVPTSVVVTTSKVEVGSTKQQIATAYYSDYTSQDVTTQVTWDSNQKTIATISNADGQKGVATGVAAGTATIVATLGDVQGSSDLGVITLSSIDVTPKNATISGGATLQYTAIGTYSDSSTATITSSVAWDSSNKNAATITASGLATGGTVPGGSTTISAAKNGKTGSTTLTRSSP